MRSAPEDGPPTATIPDPAPLAVRLDDPSGHDQATSTAEALPLTPGAPPDGGSARDAWQIVGAVGVAIVIAAAWLLYRGEALPRSDLGALSTQVSRPRSDAMTAIANRAGFNTPLARPPATVARRASPVARTTAGAITPAPAGTAVALVPPASANLAGPVDGVPIEPLPPPPVLRGMGYNPTYATAGVPAPLRVERLRRDMRRMAEIGVNMVLGWEPEVFDETLLDAAAEQGIVVVMPFDLKPSWDYADPDLREAVTRDVAAWVLRYRDHPAIVMWGLGNEVTLPMDDAQMRGFAAFWVELFDVVRELDPSRPIVLREAEDVFAPYLAEAFAQRYGGTLPPSEGPTATREELPAEASQPDASPTPAPTPTSAPVVVAPARFVYGVNFYTDRIGPALVDWVENTRLDAPLLVSEYAPAGQGRAARPQGFARMFHLIASAGPRVIGSAPYTWTTAGPEAVDAYFGLVDGEARPVGPSLALIARYYGVAPPAWVTTPPPRDDLASAAELPRLLDAAAAVLERRTALDDHDLRAEVEAETAIAAAELGLPELDEDEGVARAREVARLIGWAHRLSILQTDERRLFPGMFEALPLLKGMARWSRGEPSAVETAQLFMADVLARDLASLASN